MFVDAASIVEEAGEEEDEQRGTAYGGASDNSCSFVTIEAIARRIGIERGDYRERNL